MRKINPDLQVKLEGGATTLCRCWRVKREDGRIFGFTDHDGDLTFNDTVFKANSSLNATAVQATTGFAVDNAQALGALSDTGISEADVSAGRFDRASVQHWLVDWTDPSLNVLLFTGSFGEIRRKDGAFEVELRGQAEALNIPVGRTLQRTCDRRLGDVKCGFDVSKPSHSAEATVSVVHSASRLSSAGLAGYRADWFQSGALTWLSGQNSGVVSAVKVDLLMPDGTRRLDLWTEPGAPISVGDRFLVHAGCDKTVATCREKFGNLLNFRGFPQIPGDDWVTAYPKNGEVHDGSSRNR